MGLGTDIAGGYSPSMLSAMRHAVLNSRFVRMLRTDRARRGDCAHAPASPGAPAQAAPATVPDLAMQPAAQAAARAGGDCGHTAELVQGSPGNRGQDVHKERCAQPGVAAGHEQPGLLGCSEGEHHARQERRSDDQEGGDGRCSGQQSMPAAETLSVDGPGEGKPLDYKGAFWLATMGGAEALGLQAIAHNSRPCSEPHLCFP